MKTLLAAVLLALISSGTTLAQNPQSQVAPPFAVNAKWVNGIAPGYAPLSGTGLHISVGQGSVNCLGTVTNYAGGTLALTASTTNYVYLDAGASCAPTVKTTAFVNGDIPVATVVTGVSGITSISDARTFFYAGVGVAANPASPGYAVQFANSGASAFQGDSTFTWNPATHSGTFGGTDYLPRGCVNVKATLPSGLGAGAVGNGVADDTAALIAHVEYANGNPVTWADGSNHACVKFPAGRYKQTAPINWGAIVGSPTVPCTGNTSIVAYGEGPFTSVIEPDLPAGTNRVDEDFGGCSHSGFYNLGLVTQSGDYSTIGILSSHGNQNGLIGDWFGADNYYISLQASSSAYGIGMLWCATDLSANGSTYGEADGVGTGEGLAAGDTLPPEAVGIVGSPFYTLATGAACNGNNGFTHLSLGDNMTFTSGHLGGYGLDIEATSEVDGGKNIYVQNQGASPAALRFHSSRPTVIQIQGLRTETNNVTTTGAYAVDFDGSAGGSYSGYLGGFFSTAVDTTTAVFGGNGNIWNLTISSNCVGNAGSKLFNLTGQLAHSHIQCGTYGGSLVAGTLGTLTHTTISAGATGPSASQLQTAVTTDGGQNTFCAGANPCIEEGTNYRSVNFFMSGTQAAAPYAIFALPAAVTLDRILGLSLTAAAGCSAQPVVQVYDASSSTVLASLTQNNGSNTGSTSPNVTLPAGDYIEILGTAGTGCSTEPANTNVVLQYH